MAVIDIIDEDANKGFVVVKNLFLDSELDKVYDEILSVSLTYCRANGICDEFHDKSLEDIFLLMKNFDEQSYGVFLSNLWRLHGVNRLLSSDKIEELLKTKFRFSNLMNSGGHVVHLMSNQLRFSEGYFGLPAHQDFPSTQGSLDAVVLWVPIQDVTTEHFPVTALSGRHKEGLLKSSINSNLTWEISDYDGEHVEEILCNKGDLVIFSVFTPHKTGDGSKPRLALSTRYDNIGDLSYAKRNFFCGYGRTVKRKINGDLHPSTKRILVETFGDNNDKK
jgi:hypothetical protein